MRVDLKFMDADQSRNTGQQWPHELLGACVLCCCRFRAVHEEVVKLDQDFGATFSGVLTDDDGRVRALWGSYAEQVGTAAQTPQGWHSLSNLEADTWHVPWPPLPTCKQKLWTTPQLLFPI